MSFKKITKTLAWPFLSVYNFFKTALNLILKSLFYVFSPYQVIKKESFTFLLWVAVVIVIGQFGIILSLLVNYSIGFEKNIFTNLTNGNFYIFSISILGIALYDGFTQYLNSNETTLFKRYQIGSWIFAFILVIFMSAEYAITIFKGTIPFYTHSKIDGYIQILFYFLSIALSIYIFAVKNLDKHELDFFHLADNQDVNELKLNASNLEETIEGGIEI
jgi:hypothetical protein